MSVRPRLTLSGRGLGASVTIGPLRITRSGRGRWSLGLALPRARARRARDPRTARPAPRPDRLVAACRQAPEGAWPAPEGAPLPGPTPVTPCDCGAQLAPLPPPNNMLWGCSRCGTIRDYSAIGAGPREGA